jgi:hypothetical protein
MKGASGRLAIPATARRGECGACIGPDGEVGGTVVEDSGDLAGKQWISVTLEVCVCAQMGGGARTRVVWFVARPLVAE